MLRMYRENKYRMCEWGKRGIYGREHIARTSGIIIKNVENVQVIG